MSKVVHKARNAATAKKPLVYLKNNVIAFAAQLFLGFLPIFMWVLVPLDGQGGWLVSLMMFLVVPALSLLFYVGAGLLLDPRPKHNFLSVAGLLFIMVLIFGAPLFLADASFAALLTEMLFNMGSVMIVSLLLEPFFGSEIPYDILSFIAALMPSLFIYLGLRLQIWHTNKKEGIINADSTS